MKEVKLITEQQELAFREYEKNAEELGDDWTMTFWDWYKHHCHENNLYNDRQSHQTD